MAEAALADQDKSMQRVAAGKMPPWEVGELPPAPLFGWRHLAALVGPGLMMVGANIGGGEWLFGPAVTAQYGALVMWLATLSIVFQVFYNLEVMRYTLYCGEPVFVGFFRTMPGPRFWTICYLILDFGAIWPYLAANAAVPLAAAFLGDLPREEHKGLIQWLSYAIFLAAYIPVIFGGKIYNSLEKVMVAKIVLVLGYLTFVAVFMMQPRTAGEIFTGFLRFGTLPVRAQTIIVDGRFVVSQSEDGTNYVAKGTIDGGKVTGTFSVSGVKTTYSLSEGAKPDQRVPEALRERVSRMLERPQAISAAGGFYCQRIDGSETLAIEGVVDGDRRWQPTKIELATASDGAQTYTQLDEVPEPARARVRAFLDHQGLEPVNMFTYWFEKGHLPSVNWAMLAAFAAIAGAGGMSNSHFSNYARDKGWGMGPQVGAIPSAVGGKTIALSHVGKVFVPRAENHARWRGWYRHIVRDQVAVWMVGCILGMALPSMLSLEYIRNAPVEGNQVAAMTARGIEARSGHVFWFLTLLCGFLVLAPSQVATMDGIVRRWTDVIWTGSKWLRHLEGHKVKIVYYGIMTLYGLWGLFALTYMESPLWLATVSAVLMNFALGFSSFHTLWVNRSLLPRELRPNGLMQAGLVACGLFFIGISAIAFTQNLPAILNWFQGKG